MKFNCIKCNKYIGKLDIRKNKNKDEDALLCKQCLNETKIFAAYFIAFNYWLR